MAVVSSASLNQPSKVYPVFVGSEKELKGIFAPDSHAKGVIGVPPFVSKVRRQ